MAELATADTADAVWSLASAIPDATVFPPSAVSDILNRPESGICVRNVMSVTALYPLPPAPLEMNTILIVSASQSISTERKPALAETKSVFAIYSLLLDGYSIVTYFRPEL